MVAVPLIKVGADEKVESWSSAMVVYGAFEGVFEEVLCHHQRMVVDVDVLVRADGWV